MANSVAASSAPGRMAKAARAFIDALEPAQRSQACAPFDAPDRREFTYLPGPRPGLALFEMSAEQRVRALELLSSGLSERGLATARAVMQLEEILADIERSEGRAGWERRHPEYYWFRVLGHPGGVDPWAWAVGGHHLAVNLTMVGERVVSGTPQFFGANPATVPAGHPQSGSRMLVEEQELARSLLAAFSPAQREQAVYDAIAPNDILTRHDPVADAGRIPPGLMYRDMDHTHQEMLSRLVRHYLDRVIPDVAEPSWREIVESGLDQVSFRWAGPDEPGHGHYYAVMGPTFLLEYDNTQNDANHIHTVWRDLRHDWGDDILAAHYAAHRH